MAKCEKCGKEYQDGAEHTCSSQSKEQKSEKSEPQEEEETTSN